MTVLQPWLEQIPIRMQSTLILGLRGPDTHAAPNVKAIGRWLRGLAFKPGNPDNVAEFMKADLPERIVEKGPAAKELEFCSQHYYSHLMHALEVVAMCHPDERAARHAGGLYMDMCDLMHLPMESMGGFWQRLGPREWPGDGQPNDAAEAIQLLSEALKNVLSVAVEAEDLRQQLAAKDEKIAELDTQEVTMTPMELLPDELNAQGEAVGMSDLWYVRRIAELEKQLSSKAIHCAACGGVECHSLAEQVCGDHSFSGCGEWDGCPYCKVKQLEAQLTSAKARLDALRPGTPERIANAMFDVAEKHGRSPVSAKHALTFLDEQLAAKDEEIERLVAELQRTVIANDKEFWKNYADETVKEIAASNSKLTTVMIEQAKEIASLRKALTEANRILKFGISEMVIKAQTIIEQALKTSEDSK